MTTVPPLTELRANPDTAEWYEELAGAAATTSIRWPEPDALVETLRFFQIPEDDIAVVRPLYPHVSATGDLRWIVEQYVHLLHARMGQPGYHPLPALPAGFGELGLHLYTFVPPIHFPHTLAYHRSRGIGLAVTRETMADIGHHYLVERNDRKRSGLAGGNTWLTLHSRGLIYQFGRLQFEITSLEPATGDAMRAAGVTCATGDPVLGVHIPGLMGPFPPAACDASFTMATSFFARHFPDLGLRFATCESWLLDPQLGDYLPATSNIVQFQRRFHPVPSSEPGNEAILNFVFRSPGTPIDALPQRTTLERAIVQHIREGKSWHVGVGWLPLTPFTTGRDTPS